MFCQWSSLFTLSKFVFTVQCLPASSPQLSNDITSPFTQSDTHARACAFFSIFARGLRQVHLDFFTGSLNLDNTNFVAFWLILVLRMGQETAVFIHKQHTTKAAFYSLRVSPLRFWGFRSWLILCVGDWILEFPAYFVSSCNPAFVCNSIAFSTSTRPCRSTG